MTTTPSSAPDYPPAKPATSVGQVFALVAGFLALAAIGAAIGWAVTDTSGPAPIAVTTPTPSVVVTPTPTPTPTTNPGDYPVPNFHADGIDFISARAQLRAKSLGVLLIFNGPSGGSPVVTRTEPAAGMLVNKGITVKVYVSEAAPVLAVPNVVGSTCPAAKTALVNAGFGLKYASGKTGVVIAQDPTSDVTNAHWNDIVLLECRVPTPSPSAPPSGGPSDPPVPSASPA